MNTVEEEFRPRHLARPILKRSIAPNKADVEKKPIVKLAEAVDASQAVLFEANTVFPFTLFPDTLKIDRDKLVITRRKFLASLTL